MEKNKSFILYLWTKPVSRVIIFLATERYMYDEELDDDLEFKLSRKI